MRLNADRVSYSDVNIFLETPPHQTLDYSYPKGSLGEVQNELQPPTKGITILTKLTPHRKPCKGHGRAGASNVGRKGNSSNIYLLAESDTGKQNGLKHLRAHGI